MNVRSSFAGCSPFDFSLPTRIHFGAGVRHQLPGALLDCQARKVLVVTDKGVMNTGLVTPFIEKMSHHGLSVSVFDDVRANPTEQTVNRAAMLARHQEVDTILAIGGGSSLDTGKGVAAILLNNHNILDFEGQDKVEPPTPPVLAIPTTAGTGSEVTSWAVITDTKNRFKAGVGSRHLAPAVALLDPELTLSLPRSLTASTGIDALTHAIEGFTARCANPISDGMALQAMELIAGSLEQAVHNGQDLQARESMLLGSLLAGIAFGNSDTAGVHSMAEALGAMFDVPHGEANAIFLPYVMGYNLPEIPERIERIGRAMGISPEKDLPAVETGRLTIRKIQALITRLDIPHLKATGIDRQDLPTLAEKAHQNLGTPDNAREIDATGYLELFTRAFEQADPF